MADVSSQNWALRSIYMSDFRARFRTKLERFREQKIIVCLENL